MEDKDVKIINEKEAKRLGLKIDPERLKNYEAQGNTVSFLVVLDKLVAVIALGDVIKPEAKEFIQTIKEKILSQSC